MIKFITKAFWCLSKLCINKTFVNKMFILKRMWNISPPYTYCTIMLFNVMVLSNTGWNRFMNFLRMICWISCQIWWHKFLQLDSAISKITAPGFCPLKKLENLNFSNCGSIFRTPIMKCPIKVCFMPQLYGRGRYYVIVSN